MTRQRTFLVVGAATLLAAPALRPHAPDYPSALVREAPFTDVLVESGTLTAARMALYSAPVGPAQAKIVELVTEGTAVKPGDRLIRFDTSSLEEELAREQAVHQEAEADRLRAADDFKVEQLRATSDEASAQSRVDYAQQALDNQVDGQGRVETAEADAAAAEAARNADRARKAFVNLQPLLAQGFITKVELEKAEAAAKAAESASTLASMRAQALANFARPAAIGKARSELGLARDSVGRERDIAVARLQQAQAAVGLAETRLAQSDARQSALSARITASVVTAETAGLVIYRDTYFGGDRRKPQVGDTVAPNQPVLAVPDPTHLTVETRVREIDVARVAAGQRATVRLDALPGLAVPARISLVGALALDDPSRSGTRFFSITVALDAPDPQLRPGMTARVEMPSTAFPRALIVPIGAVFDAGGAHYCVVLEGGQPVRRAVSLGAVNETEAAIGSGLRVGERVLLVDPTEDARVR